MLISRVALLACTIAFGIFCSLTVAWYISPPLGAVTITSDNIVHTTSEVSVLQLEFERSVILTFTLVEGVFGIVQFTEPSAVFPELMVVQLVPLSIEY